MSVSPAFGTQHKVMSGKKRIMVCGGAGFIGCHLCRRLLDMVIRVLSVLHLGT